MLWIPILSLAAAVVSDLVETRSRHEAYEGYGQLPGTSPQQIVQQKLQAGIAAQPGSWTQRRQWEEASHQAMNIRAAGGDPGEAGWAAMRAARPRRGGGIATSVSPGWGRPWQGSGVRGRKTADEIADSVVAQIFGS